MSAAVVDVDEQWILTSTSRAHQACDSLTCRYGRGGASATAAPAREAARRARGDGGARRAARIANRCPYAVLEKNHEFAIALCASMGSPMYKIVLGMSCYIHSGGLGALVDGLRPVFKESTEGAVNVLEPEELKQCESIYIAPPKVKSKNLVRWTPPT